MDSKNKSMESIVVHWNLKILIESKDFTRNLNNLYGISKLSMESTYFLMDSNDFLGIQ